jgi:hypothetical protein
MSTKIFDAYRVKDAAKLWQVLADIRERGQKEVVERFRAYYIEQIETIDPESTEYAEARAKLSERSEVALRLQIAETRLREGAKKSTTSMQRGYFDLDVDVAVTRHETGFYLRAFCDRVSVLGGSLDFLNNHPELEDFHFQDQCGPPDEFEGRHAEWEARGRIWDEMMTPPGSGMFKNQVVVEISNWTAFWYLNPWLELAREFHANPPMLPPREEVLSRTLRKLAAFREVAAEPGRIVGTTVDGAMVTITRAGKRSQKKQWITAIDGKHKAHASLNRAVDSVCTRYMDGHMRRMVDRYRREAREKTRREQAARKALRA